MKEEITWGKTHIHYKPEFKKYGFELKVEVERKGYRDNVPRSFQDINDFTIYINGEYNMNYFGISFDILDCILFGYLNAFRLMECEIKEIEEARAIKVELPDSWIIKEEDNK